MKTKPSMQFLAVKCQQDAPARIDIRGPIDMAWDDENYTFTDTEREVLKLLQVIPEDKETHVHIHSEGGSVKMALGIHNALKPRAAKLTFHNAGQMLSSATVIPVKGSKVITPKTTVYGIHRPFASHAEGDADQLQAAARTVQCYEDLFAGIYSDRTGKSETVCKNMMAKTTLMTGKQAVEEGFADETGEDEEEPDADDVKSSLRPEVLALFKDVPEEFRVSNKARADAGAPANTTPTEGKIEMQKLLLVLAELKLIASADQNEENAVAQVRASLAGIIGERERLKTDNDRFQAASKLRIEARVKAAVESKKIKPEREANLVALGLIEESNLDFLDDIAAPQSPGVRAGARGAPAAPPAKDGEDDLQAQIDAVQAEINAVDVRKLSGDKHQRELQYLEATRKLGTLTAKLISLKAQLPEFKGQTASRDKLFDQIQVNRISHN